MLGKLIAAVIAIPVLLIAVIYGLIISQGPQERFSPSETSRMDYSILTKADLSGMPRVHNFTARDSALLPYRLYHAASKESRKIYLLHDIGWHGMALHRLATSIAYTGLGDVIVPDMRGHGASPARRGAVDYPGQLEDDLMDLIKQTSEPGDAIVIVGYSFGGSLAIRFAASHQSSVDARYILLSPFLGFNSAVNRADADPLLHPLSRRITGLELFDTAGLHIGGEEIALQLAYPESLRNDPLGYTATPDITWNTLSSLDPKGVLGPGLKSMNEGVLVIAGQQDELFDASKYKDEISKYSSNVDVEIIGNADHINLVNSPKILAIIQNWLSM
ncbi:alpha/beta hydrolase [Rhizobium sp. L1K21]|uniref:alpha/beta hydrolase n=1 Tax=Rhizobium sp. L1K21 TaxID=2954933 RepID=UPI002091FEE8|nr:alpha/beta fold hydrolase [Rhizobium sp. L1K21]MCO6186664.1 alpha/beta fold hydrolase [Rhizobium sp. L1K21]